MPRVTLSDGRWLDLRPIWVSDRVAVIDLQRRTHEGLPQVEALTAIAAVVERGLQDKSWDGTLLDMSTADMLGIIVKWARASEDDALPPATGTPSNPQSPDGDSEEPTETPSEPASQTATPSTASR